MVERQLPQWARATGLDRVAIFLEAEVAAGVLGEEFGRELGESVREEHRAVLDSCVELVESLARSVPEPTDLASISASACEALAAAEEHRGERAVGWTRFNAHLRSRAWRQMAGVCQRLVPDASKVRAGEGAERG
jgi:hypothetical protein